MRTIVTVLLIFVLLAVAYNATIRAAENPIVPAGAKLELLFTRTANIAGGLTEGPAVAPDGSIYFTDMPFGSDKGMILRFDPATKKTTVFTDDSGKANGLTCDAQGEPRGMRRCRRRRPPHFALGSQDRQKPHRGRPLPGQTVQLAQRSLHRHQGPHLLHRSPLPGHRAARARLSGRLPHRHGWQGGRSDARRGKAERHRAVAR